MSRLYTFKNYNNLNNEATVQYTDDKDTGLNVEIKTDRLFIRNVQDKIEDREIFYNLLMDPINTAMYGEGVQTKEYIDESFDKWLNGWRINDVCSGLMVFDKINTSIFIGHIMLMHGKEENGEAELAIILHKDHWSKGYGSEMMDSMVHCFAPSIIQQGYKVTNSPGTLIDSSVGKPLSSLFATARVDNHGSIRVIEKAGLKYYHQQLLYGAQRKYFRLNL